MIEKILVDNNAYDLSEDYTVITLKQLVDHEVIDESQFNKVQLWWYGKDIADDYIGENGPAAEIRNIKGASFETLYLVCAGIDGTHCRYCYAICLTDKTEDGVYAWKRVPLKLDDYSKRLILYRKSGYSFYNYGLQDFCVEAIESPVSKRKVPYFTDYESVELTFDELREMVTNQYEDYKRPLTRVKGVYMIIDGNTGKQYIGSAYGENAIFARWSSYANTYHGGNEELVKLYNEFGEAYFSKFKYFLLRILPKITPDADVIEVESYYKQRYLTREFGLNSN